MEAMETDTKSDEESGDDTSDTESDLMIGNGNNGLIKTPNHTQPPPCTASKTNAFFAKVNWKNVLAVACQWVAYFLCSAGFSTIAPFYPAEVLLRSIKCSTCISLHIIGYAKRCLLSYGWCHCKHLSFDCSHCSSSHGLFSKHISIQYTNSGYY